MFIKYSDIYSRCQCSKFHCLTAPPTLSLACGPFPKRFWCIHHCAWEGKHLFLQLELCGEAQPRSSAGCAAEGTHTLWNGRSAPLASPGHAQLSPLLHDNSTQILFQFLRNYWNKAKGGRTGGEPPSISLLRLMKPPHTYLKCLRDNPVDLNQGEKGTKHWRASQQAERAGFGHQRSKEPNFFL